MKRRQQPPVKLIATKDRVLESGRLARVRGGDGVGTVLSEPDPAPSFINNQHNEALVRL
jgi:hypothetical protein